VIKCVSEVINDSHFCGQHFGMVAADAKSESLNDLTISLAFGIFISLKY